MSSDPFYRNYRVEGLNYPELWDYLGSESVRATLTGLLPGRWRSFSIMVSEWVLSDNGFDGKTYSEDDLLRDVEQLHRLRAVPLVRRCAGGTFTFRSGFEEKVLPWHWKEEDRRLLPPAATRAMISCYHDGPLLNLPLVDIFHALAGDGVFYWITRERKFDVLEFAFGPCFERNPPLLVTSHRLLPVAADHVFDGRFFDGLLVVPKSDRDRVEPILIERFRNIPTFEFHRTAVTLLGEVAFYSRRLFNDENSWYSGEVEILSQTLTPHDVEAALLQTARSTGAAVRTLSRRFSYRMLRDE